MDYYLEKIIKEILYLKKEFFRWTRQSITRTITLIIVMIIILMALNMMD